MADVYRIHRAAWDALVDHARHGFDGEDGDPFEVCGLLGVDAEGVIHHFPITNAADRDRDGNPVPSIYFYSMEPRQLLRSMREIEDHEWELTIYHSHTHTEAYPSQTDVRLAMYPEATYVIVTLQDKDHPDLRAFSIIDEVITEQRVEVVEDGGDGAYVLETAHRA